MANRLMLAPGSYYADISGNRSNFFLHFEHRKLLKLAHQMHLHPYEELGAMKAGINQHSFVAQK